MELGFGGEISDLYHRYRRGYPPELIRAVVDAFALAGNDIVIDLGCGTGQLATPIARHVRATIGVDPEADMLARAQSAARAQGVTNAGWMVGRDTELPLLRSLLGDRAVGAVTIGQALHWMDHRAVFAAARPLLRPGGGVAVVSNGIPLWLQDADWSRALRDWLEGRLGARPANTCGTDEATHQRYRESMSATGFDTDEVVITYTDELDFDQLIGGVYSAFPVDKLPPPEDRRRIAAQLRTVLDPHRPFIEHVPVKALLGTKAAAGA